MRRTPDRDAGFTLIEVIVSLAIIGTVLTSMSVFFVRSMTSVDVQGDRQTAIQLAADGMERMREGPGALVAGWLTATVPETIKINTIAYVRAWDPPKVVSTSPALVYAAVRITWRGANCPAGTCRYSTSTLVSTAETEPVFDLDRP